MLFEQTNSNRSVILILKPLLRNLTMEEILQDKPFPLQELKGDFQR